MVMNKTSNFLTNKKLSYLACIYGDENARTEALEMIAFSPQIGSCFRVLLDNIMNFLAFKQSDIISQRCWRILQALSSNPYTRDVYTRIEYFHLAEILICQLLAPFETIKGHVKVELEKSTEEVVEEISKAETITDESMQADEEKTTPLINAEAIKEEEVESITEKVEEEIKPVEETTDAQPILKLATDEDEDEIVTHVPGVPEFSPYFASPVEWEFVDLLCETIGKLAAQNGFFQSECCYLILRRLDRFFEDRQMNSDRGNQIHIFFVMFLIKESN